MNDKQAVEFRHLIESRLAELADESALGEDGRKTVELDQQSVGRLSRMDALQNQAMAKAAQARRDIEITRLQAALGRIDAGEFGFCEDCGEEIAPGRLRLDPAATRCVSCVQSG